MILLGKLLPGHKVMAYAVSNVARDLKGKMKKYKFIDVTGPFPTCNKGNKDMDYCVLIEQHSVEGRNFGVKAFPGTLQSDGYP